MSIELDDMQDVIDFNNIKPLASAYGEKNSKGYREIVLGAPDQGEQDIFLKLRDEKHTWNNLYLGRSRTFKKEKCKDRWNVIVPIVPRIYTTPDRDATHADVPRKGWIYIIRRCETPEGKMVTELWRELKSDGGGHFTDVQLKYQRGNDQRPATGQAGFRIIVPYCINKQVHELWIAFSEVQWSWARIEQMKAKDPTLRNQRMQKLDVSGCLSNFEDYQPAPPEDNNREDDEYNTLVNAAPQTALIHRLDLANDSESLTAPEGFKDPIPVIYLDDPIGIARNLAARHQLWWDQMATDLLTLKNQSSDSVSSGSYQPGRWFEAAALANRYFYGDISQVLPAGLTTDQEKANYQKQLAQTEEKFAEYRNRLDKVAIDQALGRYQRQQTRARIVAARKDLTTFLQHELFSETPEDGAPAPPDPALIQALDDYFTRPPLSPRHTYEVVETEGLDGKKQRQKVWVDNYYDGWKVVAYILTALGRHEYRLDHDLEARPADGWAWRKESESFKLLMRLADPAGGSSLHSRLFPQQSGASELDFAPTSYPTADPRFKTDNFSRLPELLSKDDTILRGMELFAHQFDEVMAMRSSGDDIYNAQLVRARCAILRLISGALELELAWQDISIDEIIAANNAKADSPSKAWSLFKNAVSLTSGTVAVIKDDKDWTGKITVKTAQGNPNRMQQLLSGIAESRRTECCLTGLAGMIKTINFIAAINAFVANKNEDKNWDKVVSMMSSFCNLGEAVTAAAAKALPKPVQGTNTQFKKAVMSKKIGIDESRLFQSVNLVFSIVDMGTTAISLVENIREGDDAAAADAMLLAGATLGVIGGVAELAGATSVALWFGLSVSLPVLGLAGIAVSLAGFLAKAFIFSEDNPIEIWLANNPYTLVQQQIEGMNFQQSSGPYQVQENGTTITKGCTIYSFNHNKLYVDEDGILVGCQSSYTNSAGNSLITQNAQQQVTIHAFMSNGVIFKDLTMGKIGQPFALPPELASKITRTNQIGQQQADTWAKETDVRNCHPGLPKKLSRIETWHEVPQECYLALVDALYRPRVKIATHAYNNAGHISCDINLPYFIPGKSKLIVQKTETTSTINYGQPGVSHHQPGEETITQEELDRMAIGPCHYRIELAAPANSVSSLEVKVRFNVYGDDKVFLPYEEKFDGEKVQKSATDTSNTKQPEPQQETKPAEKWLVVSDHLSTIKRYR